MKPQKGLPTFWICSDKKVHVYVNGKQYSCGKSKEPSDQVADLSRTTTNCTKCFSQHFGQSF